MDFSPVPGNSMPISVVSHHLQSKWLMHVTERANANEDFRKRYYSLRKGDTWKEMNFFPDVHVSSKWAQPPWTHKEGNLRTRPAPQAQGHRKEEKQTLGLQWCGLVNNPETRRALYSLPCNRIAFFTGESLSLFLLFSNSQEYHGMWASPVLPMCDHKWQ